MKKIFFRLSLFYLFFFLSFSFAKSQGVNYFYFEVDELQYLLNQKEESGFPKGVYCVGPVSDSFRKNNLEIPAYVTFQNTVYPVEYIYSGAFSGFGDRLTGSLTLPNTLKGINTQAFAGCSGFTSLNLGNGVETIGFGAFSECSGFNGELRIPDSVKCIEKDAFYYCSGFTSLNLGNGVETIEFSAFSNCKGFTGSLTIGNSVKNIDNYAFFYCSGFTSLNLGNGMETIGNSAFDHCTGFKGELRIPDSVKSIGNSAFSNCYGFTSLNLGNGVESIGKEAFEGCSGMKEALYIPLSLKQIGADAFSYAIDYSRPNFSRIEISDLTAWCNIDFEDSDSNPLSASSGSLYLNGSELVRLTIPDDVIGIKNYTFYNAKSLATVTLPETITSIEGVYAFANCSELYNIVLPESLSYIGSGVFSGCSGLYNIVLPKSLTYIGNGAFSGCSGLYNIVLPESLTYIGANAFSYCTGIDHLTIPNSVTEIGGYAFRGCAFESIDLPDKLTEIADFLFEDNKKLKSITIPKNVKTIGRYAFRSCSNLSNVVLPENLENIGTKIFYDCSSLGTINLPQSVKKISQDAFYKISKINISNLKNWCEIEFEGPINVSVYESSLYLNGNPLIYCIIPKETERINSYAFQNVYNIEHVFIPSSVTEIGEEAFDCSNLTEVRCYAVNPPGCKSNSFPFKNATLHVPAGTLDVYDSTANWFRFNKIIDDLDPDEDIYTVKNLFFSSEKYEVELGGKYTITICVEPEFIQSPSLLWISSNTDVMTISTPSNNSISAQLEAVGVGETTIIVTDITNPSISARCVITVIDPNVIRNLYFGWDTINAALGDQFYIWVNVEPAHIQSPDLTWGSSNTDVMTITPMPNNPIAALIDAIGVGETTISVADSTNPAISASCIVTVIDPNAEDGIDMILGDSKREAVDIYGINGVLIMKGADEEDIKSLESGFYIIGGKKVFIK